MVYENQNKERTPKILRRPMKSTSPPSLSFCYSPQIQPLRSPNQAIFHSLREFGSKLSCMIPNPPPIDQLHQSFQLSLPPFESLPALDPAIFNVSPFFSPLTGTSTFGVWISSLPGCFIFESKTYEPTQIKTTHRSTLIWPQRKVPR